MRRLFHGWIYGKAIEAMTLCDSLGNRTAMTAAIPASPAPAGTTSYAYDTKNELLQENSARNGGYVDSFGYDAAENPVAFRGTANTFNTDNQNTAYAYDGNGNPTAYKGTALSFDPENRLTSLGTAMTAGYDGDGLRAWKSTAAGKTYFVYDGDSPVLEMNSSGNVTAFNVWGANGLLSRRMWTASAYYTFDPQGSVVQRLDINQNILSTSAYDAWGNPLAAPTGDPFWVLRRMGILYGRRDGSAAADASVLRPGAGSVCYAGSDRVFRRGEPVRVCREWGDRRNRPKWEDCQILLETSYRYRPPA